MANYKSQKIRFQKDRAELHEHELSAPEAGQALICAHLSLISPGTERAALLGVWNDPVFRANPGYALVGEVIQSGENPAGISPSQRVVSLVGHASLALASTEPWVTLPIPDRVNDETAAFLPLASVALHALRRSKLELGEQILIIGLGIIGQIAVTLAKMQGAGKVIVMDTSEQRLELARLRGADAMILPGNEDPEKRIKSLTHGEGVPVILDATGNTRHIPENFRLAALGGRIVTIGIIDEQVAFTFKKEFMQRELTLLAASQPRCPIVPTIYQRWTQQANRQYLLELMAEGKIPVDDLITHRFPANEAPQVYEWLKQADPSLLGCILDWTDA